MDIPCSKRLYGVGLVSISPYGPSDCMAHRSFSDFSVSLRLEMLKLLGPRRMLASQGPSPHTRHEVENHF